jgi:hypothetical protein
MMNRDNSGAFAFSGRGAARAAGFNGRKEIEVVLVPPEGFKVCVLSGRFEQFAALAVLALTGWKLGSQFVGLPEEATGDLRMVNELQTAYVYEQ